VKFLIEGQEENGSEVLESKLAVEEGFGVKPILIREGGSIPIAAQMVATTNADVLLPGWGLDDDGAHSPNEKFCLEDYYRGYVQVIDFGIIWRSKMVV